MLTRLTQRLLCCLLLEQDSERYGYGKMSYTHSLHALMLMKVKELYEEILELDKRLNKDKGNLSASDSSFVFEAMMDLRENLTAFTGVLHKELFLHIIRIKKLARTSPIADELRTRTRLPRACALAVVRACPASPQDDDRPAHPFLLHHRKGRPRSTGGSETRTGGSLERTGSLFRKRRRRTTTTTTMWRRKTRKGTTTMWRRKTRKGTTNEPLLRTSLPV